MIRFSSTSSSSCTLGTIADTSISVWSCPAGPGGRPEPDQLRPVNDSATLRLLPPLQFLAVPRYHLASAFHVGVVVVAWGGCRMV
jgi:hypothetical protein